MENNNTLKKMKIYLTLRNQVLGNILNIKIS